MEPFGAMTPYNGPYHPSVYRKYSRGGGSENAVGTPGEAFAYKRPRFPDGGTAECRIRLSGRVRRERTAISAWERLN